MEYDFGARATLSAQQCAASYMYDFKVKAVSKHELYRWGKHLNDYLDSRDLQVYVQCKQQDIEEIPGLMGSLFFSDGKNIILKNNVSDERLFENVLASVNGKLLPHLYCARSLFAPQNDAEVV